MRLNYKLILGIICVLVGIVVIIYAQHHLHQTAPVVVQTAKSYWGHVHDFFTSLWAKITGHKQPEPIPVHKTGAKIALGLGIAMTALGALLVLFSRRK